MMMIPTLLFATSTLSAVDQCTWPSERLCLNDWQNCAWYSQCTTRSDGHCSPMTNINACLAKSQSFGCVWIGDRSNGHCEIDTDCGMRGCQTECQYNSQCTWESSCGSKYNEPSQQQLQACELGNAAKGAALFSSHSSLATHKQLCAGALQDFAYLTGRPTDFMDVVPSEPTPWGRRPEDDWELEETKRQVLLHCCGAVVRGAAPTDFSSQRMDAETKRHVVQYCDETLHHLEGRRLEDESAEDEEDSEEDSVDSEEPDSEESSEDGDNNDTRRLDSTFRRQLCSGYSTQDFCDLQKHCRWIGNNRYVGTCQPKTAYRCDQHSSESACGGTGRDGRPCTWIGSPHVGTCQEEQAPPMHCGMFYTASACPSSCLWNGHYCTEHTTPSPPPMQCGMFYSELSCPTGCYWNGHTCQQQRDCGDHTTLGACHGVGMNGRPCTWSGDNAHVGVCHERAPRVQCGMLYDESTCNLQPNGVCYWNGWQCQKNVIGASAPTSQLSMSTAFVSNSQGCRVHTTAATCGGTGKDGRVCSWVGGGPSGVCLEQGAPLMQCGMFFTASACPSSCEWNGHTCTEHTTPSPPTMQCGMFFTASACPSSCNWNGNTCTEQTAPSMQCGMFFTASACPTSCEWNGHSCTEHTTPSPATMHCGMFYMESSCPAGCYWSGKTCQKDQACENNKTPGSCVGLGNDGRPCSWSGTDTAGVCKEDAAIVNCGMLFSQSACASQSLHGCVWKSNTCYQHHQLLDQGMDTSFVATPVQRTKQVNGSPVDYHAHTVGSWHPARSTLDATSAGSSHAWHLARVDATLADSTSGAGSSHAWHPARANLDATSTAGSSHAWHPARATLAATSDAARDHQCGMFYTASACPTNGCEWTGTMCQQHPVSLRDRCMMHRYPSVCGQDDLCSWSGVAQVGACVPKTTPAPAPMHCGMFYAETACPAGCEWRHNQCQEKRDPVLTCGLFYSSSACPRDGCRWTGSHCVAHSTTTCSDALNYSDCHYSDGCKWSLTQSTCKELDWYDDHCKKFDRDECGRRWWSSGCYYNEHSHVCLSNY